MNDRRYNYSASYTAQVGGVGGGSWLTLDEVRKAVAAMLRDPRFDPGSIRVIVQQKRSRWVPLAHGTIAEIFPDLWTAWLADKAQNEVLAEHCLALGEKPTPARRIYRSEVDFELRTHGLAGALARAEEKLAQAQALLSVLRAVATARAQSGDRVTAARDSGER